MTGVAEEAPGSAREEDRPRWDPVPERHGDDRRRALVGIVVRATIAVVVAAVLFALGHRVPAVVLLAVLTVATVASLRSPRVAAGIDRAVAAIQRVAGRVLAVVLLGGVNLLIITPIALVLRLVRHDPLALGLPADAPTRWRPTPQRPGRGAGGGLYRRPYAYERMPRPAVGRGRLPLLRLRAALGLLALLAIADLALGTAIRQVSDDRPDGGSQTLMSLPGAAAGREEPWRRELDAELSEVWNTKPYDPYLAWRTPDFSGRHLTVTGGVRQTPQLTPVGRGEPLEVWFFGGSAMFGLFQRDEQAIPAVFSRLAAQDGVRLRAVNRATMAYTNWQEVLLLQRLLTSGERPDLAVFYDGFNEVLSQFVLGPHDEPSHVGAREIEQRLARTASRPGLRRSAYDAWAESSAAHRVAREIGLARPLGYDLFRVRSPFVAQSLQVEKRGVDAAAVHARGVDVARRLGRSYGFDTAFFWQPTVYSKRVRPGEEDMERYLGADADAWGTADGIARERLAPGVRDLGDALDGVRAPVMYDYVHTNEAGAEAVARRLYAELRPALKRASAEGERP